MKKYYIYYMIHPITKQLFYIGKGTTGRSRRWVGHVNEARKWNDKCKWGNKKKLLTIKEILEANLYPICKIVYETDNENDAYHKEYRLIKKYGRLHNKTGILTNLMEGGSGCSQSLYSENKRKILSERMTGINNPMYGKHHDEFTKKAISRTRIERIKSGDIIPTKHSEEWKQHLRENNAGGKATAKRTCQISPVDGTIIKTWESSRQAGISLGIKTWRNISQCCNKFKTRTSGGYYWRWENDNSIIDNKIQNIYMLNLKRKGKPINQIDDDNNIIKTWNTMGEIAKHYGVVASAITQTVKNRLYFNNYYWEYA